jgi:hypothetical protein
MSFLIIKKSENCTSSVQELSIDKQEVSAIYSEATLDANNPIPTAPGKLVLSMKSGKEFKFDYPSYLMAGTAVMVLSVAVQTGTAADITI